MILPDGTRLVVAPSGCDGFSWDSRKWAPYSAPTPGLLDGYGRPAHVEPIPTADPPDTYIVPERLLVLYPPEKPWVRIVW